jgi:hypothetical protein
MARNTLTRRSRGKTGSRLLNELIAIQARRGMRLMSAI